MLEGGLGVKGGVYYEFVFEGILEVLVGEMLFRVMCWFYRCGSWVEDGFVRYKSRRGKISLGEVCDCLDKCFELK